MNKLKVMTVVGTRPEIIKLSQVMKELDEHTDHTIVHTGQNYDYELNELFFEQLEIRKPDIFLEAIKGSPSETIGDIIAEPLTTFYPEMPVKQVQAKVVAIMEKVGLLQNQINRYPHEFSGGQCQRIGIARALILEPKLIICDEPVSALDVSIQAQVVNLLMQLQDEMGLSLIFIAHDLSVIRHISDRVLVMYLGNPVELGEAEEIYKNPLHPYTKALMSAVPIPDPKVERNKSIEMLEGDLPSPISPPSGCAFRTRCPIAGPECSHTKPALEGTFKHAISCLNIDPL